jgi:hypothetical protein
MQTESVKIASSDDAQITVHANRVKFCGKQMTAKKRNWLIFAIVSAIVVSVGFALLYVFVINVAHASVQFKRISSVSSNGLFVSRDFKFGTLDASASLNYTPSVVEWKLIALYLAQDIDNATSNNIGETQMLWLNDDCKDDISSCNADNVNTWFDFAAGLTEVNSKLNDQKRSVKPGTYKYVRMEFCKNSATKPNFKYQAGNMTEPFEFVNGVCGETSQEANPPLSIQRGQQVQVIVDYSLEGSVLVWDSDCGAQYGCAKDPVYNKWYQMDYNRMNFLPSEVKVVS